MYILKGSILLDFDTTMENICAISLKKKVYELEKVLNESTQKIMVDYGNSEETLNHLLGIAKYKKQLKEDLAEVLAPYEIGVFIRTLENKNLNICLDSKNFAVEILEDY